MERPDEFLQDRKGSHTKYDIKIHNDEMKTFKSMMGLKSSLDDIKSTSFSW